MAVLLLAVATTDEAASFVGSRHPFGSTPCRRDNKSRRNVSQDNTQHEDHDLDGIIMGLPNERNNRRETL